MPAFALLNPPACRKSLVRQTVLGQLYPLLTSHPLRPMHPTLKIAFASATLAWAVTTNVNAQSSSGNITGEAAIGDTVTITGVDTGFKRELRIEKDGKYQIRRVPTGEYYVVRVHKDGTTEPTQSIVVRPGGTARVMEAGKTEAKDVFSGS